MPDAVVGTATANVGAGGAAGGCAGALGAAASADFASASLSRCLERLDARLVAFLQLPDLRADFGEIGVGRRVCGRCSKKPQRERTGHQNGSGHEPHSSSRDGSSPAQGAARPNDVRGGWVERGSGKRTAPGMARRRHRVAEWRRSVPTPQVQLCHPLPRSNRRRIARTGRRRHRLAAAASSVHWAAAARHRSARARAIAPPAACRAAGTQERWRRFDGTQKAPAATVATDDQVYRNSTANSFGCLADAYIYILPAANVGASTAAAASVGSLIVIRHSVRGSSGSTSVAECSSDALSQITTSPTP